jgi:hypothetical protein
MDKSLVKKLGVTQLFQEHDILKTILFEIYRQSSFKVFISYEKFNKGGDFDHLGDVDLLSLAQILDRFAVLGVIEAKAGLEKNIFTIYPLEDDMKNYLALIESEINSRHVLGNLPKLVFFKDRNLFEYQDKTGTTFSAYFRNSTNQFKLLSVFLNSPKNAFETTKLANYLLEPREGGEGASEKNRVIDTITAINKKFKCLVIHKSKQGYILDCNVELK